LQVRIVPVECPVRKRRNVSNSELSRIESEKEGRRSEFKESVVEGVRLCQEACTCAVVTVIFEVTARFL
jgi:hypothetical protein